MSRSDESRELTVLVHERIDRWRQGSAPDAAVMLDEHPELRDAKSLVMDLAWAEYAIRTASGDSVEPKAFCDRFPAYRQSIARMIDVQEYLDRCPAFAMDDERTRWPRVGEDFLGYELVEPLGRGGLARVFLARECELGGRLVVVKVSRHGGQEAATLGKLSHASIVPVYSVQHDAAEEWTAICMPLVGVATGIDLLDVAFAPGAERNGALVERVAAETKPQEPLPAGMGQQEHFAWDLTYGEAVARMGMQVAEGLAAAHAAGIVHGDIKPSNLLLAWSGRAMLLDFNLSSDVSAVGGRFGGTLAYMAPEVLSSVISGRGEAAGRLDPRSDVYSLGAVLYELLTNRLPARPADAERLAPDDFEPWLECKRVRPEVVADAGIDHWLMGIVQKCLAFDAADRYASAAEVATELGAYLKRAARPKRRVSRWRRAALAAGVLLVLGGGAAWAYVGSRGTSAELLYQQGLHEYEQGKYEEAVSTFTKCLERRSGWPDALFGRAQALRKQEKWREARTDYLALHDADTAWSYAMAGYCSMRVNDNSGAHREFEGAYQAGLREIPFLLNYARLQTNRQMPAEAVALYNEVVAVDASNVQALCNRALARVAMVWNDKKRPLSAEALADAAEACRLEPKSFEAACCAAIVFGEAARKDAKYEAPAVGYLADSLRKGMPIEAIDPYSVQLKRLVSLVDEETVASARRASNYRIDFRPAVEPSNTGSWESFQKQFGKARSLLARTK